MNKHTQTVRVGLFFNMPLVCLIFPCIILLQSSLIQDYNNCTMSTRSYTFPREIFPLLGTEILRLAAFIIAPLFKMVHFCPHLHWLCSPHWLQCWACVYMCAYVCCGAQEFFVSLLLGKNLGFIFVHCTEDNHYVRSSSSSRILP